MATDTATPARSGARLSNDLDRPTGKVLPLLLLVLLVVGLAYGVKELVTFIQGVQSTEAVETKFVLRRMTESVRLFEPVPLFGRTIGGKLFWVSLLFVIPVINAGFLARRYYLLKQPVSLGRWVVGAVLFVPAVWALIFALQPTGRTPYLEVEGPFFWSPILTVTLALAGVYVVWMYISDGKAVGWLWATFLGTLRLTVYAVLAGVFLLPALQTWEKSESISRVLLLLDISGSMGLTDEVPEEGQPTPPSRLDQVHALLTENKSAFIDKLQEKNPVVAYTFGGKLDEDFREFKKDHKPFTAEDWAKWLRMDLKQWLLEGLSPEGQAVLKASSGFESDKPGTPEWATEWLRTAAIPADLKPADKDILENKRQKLPRRVELRQQILTGTNIGDSALTALTRESTNMIAGIVVVTDGESNQGSPSTFEELRRRATNLRVPIFTVGVGEVREQINIRITDLQAPQQGPPDEKFMVRVEVDGEGLNDKDFAVTLDVYKPNEPKTPVMQLPGIGKFKAAGALPHGFVEFVIDPAHKDFAALVVPGQDGHPELIEGDWKFVARIPKVKGEAFAGKEHVSDEAKVQIVKKKLRVLLFAGGPTREYQFTRRLFVNEVDKGRAELSIYLQVSDPKGPRVQDVPQNQLLQSFPNVLHVDDDPAEKPEDKYYNLAQYDLIIAFDPDWLQVPRESLDLLQRWVEVQAGGLIVVSGPINTFQLARSDNYQKIKPIVDLMPVRVEDSRLQGFNIDRTTGRPWRLKFPGVTSETEYLRLDDEVANKEDPKAKKDVLDSWETFFTGRDKWLPKGDEVPLRGFYSYYPVKSIKPTASVIATFTDPQALMTKEDNSTEPQPYLVTMQYGKGKVLYLSSGELWRLRLFKETFHERVWTKLGRFAASGTQTKLTRRGSINIGRQYTVGQYVRLNAPLYGADLNPLPKSAEPTVKIIPPQGGGPTVSVKLTPRRDGDWSGQFEGQFQVTTPGEYKLELPVPGSSETLHGKTLAREANVELDRSRPNFGLLRTHLASTVTDLRVTDALKADLKSKLRTVAKPDPTEKAAPREDAKEDVPLFFDLKSAKMIPDYLNFERKTQKNRGPVEDLWPTGPVLSLFGKSGVVGTVLLLVVGLLSIEWLTRKLLRLA